MATYLDETHLAKFQDSQVQTEVKIGEFGLIEQAQNLNAQAAWLSSAARATMSTIFDRDWEIPAIKDNAITILSEESFDIPVNQSTSEMVTATKITMFTGFRWNPSTFLNNVVGEEEYKADMYNKIFKAFALTKEAYIQTKFEALKTQQLAISGGDGITFDTGTDTMKITKAAQTDTMALDIRTILGENNLGNDYSLSAGYGLGRVINQLTKYGAANDKNLQVLGLPNIHYSNQITKAGGDNWTGFLATPGAIAMVENHLPDFILNRNIKGKQFGITSRPVPYLNERIMMFQNEDTADVSGTGAYASELKMSYYKEEGFISKFFVIGQYNSDIANRVNNIIKINGLSS